MAILPDAFSNDERGGGVQTAKDFHAHFLRVNEAMLFLLIERVSAHNGPALGFQSAAQHGFHFGLLGPASLVGREAQVSVGHQVKVPGFEGSDCFHVPLVL